VTRRGQLRLVLSASGVWPNTGADRYAVWLSAGPSGKQIRLGFVDPGVGRNGNLSMAGALPRTARAYRLLIVTRERSSRPARPGAIILSGRLAIC
jgi:hypothetical protein